MQGGTIKKKYFSTILTSSKSQKSIENLLLAHNVFLQMNLWLIRRSKLTDRSSSLQKGILSILNNLKCFYSKEVFWLLKMYQDNLYIVIKI